MNRKIRLIFVSLLLLLAACGYTDEDVAATIAALPARLALPTYTPAPTCTPRVVTPTASPPTTTPTTPEIGTRGNPYPFGEEGVLVRGGVLHFTMTIVEVYRGQLAFARILDANQFNDPAPEGMEWVLARVAIEYTGADEGILEISKWELAIITVGRVIRWEDTLNYNPCCLEPDLEFMLFHGGAGTGWIALPVAVDDEAPVLVIGLASDGSGGVFFSLVS